METRRHSEILKEGKRIEKRGQFAEFLRVHDWNVASNFGLAITERRAHNF